MLLSLHNKFLRVPRVERSLINGHLVRGYANQTPLKLEVVRLHIPRNIHVDLSLSSFSISTAVRTVLFSLSSHR